MNRRTGKIARLPKQLREVVNHMLDDGIQYESIIRALENHRQSWPDGVSDISVNNLSNWHSGGYQDWVRDAEIAADLKSRSDLVSEVATQHDPQKLHETVVHVGVAQLYHALAAFDRDAVQATLAQDPASYAKLLSVLLRFSNRAVQLQQLKLHTVATAAKCSALGCNSYGITSGLERRKLDNCEHNSTSIPANSR